MTLDQVYDELYGEIDQIKNELKNTLSQIQYASNFTEGISLGTLTVGAESSQVIAPHVTLLPGAESGMMLLDLPVGTESGMLPVQIQDDPEATELVPDAIPTGETIESLLNSKLGNQVTSELYGSITLIRKGKMRQLIVSYGIMSGITNQTIPSDDRPPYTVNAPCVFTNNAMSSQLGCGLMSINSNGEIGFVTPGIEPGSTDRCGTLITWFLNN